MGRGYATIPRGARVRPAVRRVYQSALLHPALRAARGGRGARPPLVSSGQSAGGTATQFGSPRITACDVGVSPFITHSAVEPDVWRQSRSPLRSLLVSSVCVSVQLGSPSRMP